MKRIAFALLLSCAAGSAAAAPIVTSGASRVSGDLRGGSADLIVDGATPSEGSEWQTNTAFWTGTEVTLQVDLGGIYRLDDLTLSVDNNDDYRISYGLDASTFATLFEIGSGLGNSTYGMDTMSTLATDPDYVSALDFGSVSARYLRIAAIDGDDLYSVGEITAFGVRAAPVPAPLALILCGLAVLGGRRRTADRHRTIRPAA